MATDPNRDAEFNIQHIYDPCEDAISLKAKAERCRRLAAGISDGQTSDVLTRMARNYQEAADRLLQKD